jgi:peptidoglycan hydrolase CwlO-like protein
VDDCGDSHSSQPCGIPKMKKNTKNTSTKSNTNKSITNKIQNIHETIDNLMFLINEGDISPNEIYNRLEALDAKIERLEESL